MAANPFMPPTAQAAAAAAGVSSSRGLPAGPLQALCDRLAPADVFVRACATGQMRPGAAGSPNPAGRALLPTLQAKKVDYMELPQPVRYEELQREVMSECGQQRQQRRQRWTAAASRRHCSTLHWTLCSILHEQWNWCVFSAHQAAVAHTPFMLLPAAAAPAPTVSLKPDLFEGLRFDLTKPLNHNFALSHSIFMGNIDVPTANPSQVGSRPCRCQPLCGCCSRAQLKCYMLLLMLLMRQRLSNGMPPPPPTLARLLLLLSAGCEDADGDVRVWCQPCEQSRQPHAGPHYQ